MDFVCQEYDSVSVSDGEDVLDYAVRKGKKNVIEILQALRFLICIINRIFLQGKKKGSKSI